MPFFQGEKRDRVGNFFSKGLQVFNFSYMLSALKGVTTVTVIYVIHLYET